jgi:epoxyqueuosine reductase QueG
VANQASSAVDARDVDHDTQNLLATLREARTDRVGATSAAPLDRAGAAIESRVAAGRADSMPSTFRNPERSTAPTMSVPGARSIIVAARLYSCDGDVSAAAVVPARAARLAEHARWAAGKLGIGSLVCDELVP